MLNTASVVTLAILLCLFAGCDGCGGNGKPTPDAAPAADAKPDVADGPGGTTDGPILDTSPEVSPVDTPPVDSPPPADTADAGGDASGDLGPGMTTKVTQFPSGMRPCGLAYDDGANIVWVFPCSSTMAHGFTPAGMAMGTVALQGEGADDGDLDIAPRALMLGTTMIPAGSLLFINGETAAAEVYATDRTTKAPLGMLATMYGDSHVVGGAFHAARGTLFLVQDRQTGAGNTVAEINATTGAVVAMFSTLPFPVNYGDVEVCQPTGNLLVVSSDRPDMAEFTPTGTLVRMHAVPSDVEGLSGIGVDDTTGEVWVAGTGGNVSKLAGTPCSPRAP